MSVVSGHGWWTMKGRHQATCLAGLVLVTTHCSPALKQSRPEPATAGVQTATGFSEDEDTPRLWIGGHLQDGQVVFEFGKCRDGAPVPGEQALHLVSIGAQDKGQACQMLRPNPTDPPFPRTGSWIYGAPLLDFKAERPCDALAEKTEYTICGHGTFDGCSSFILDNNSVTFVENECDHEKRNAKSRSR